MSKIDFGDHLFDDVQQILFRSLPHFTGGEARCRMCDEDTAEPFRHYVIGENPIELIGEIHDLLEAFGFNFQVLDGRIITVRLSSSSQLN